MLAGIARRPLLLVIPTALIGAFLWMTALGGSFVATTGPSSFGSAAADWSDLTSAEADSTVSADWATAWQQAWQQGWEINVGHVFEGDAAKVRTRIRTIENVGTDPGLPNGGCYYRPASDFHTEAVVIRWLLGATFSGTSHTYNGGMFLQNLSAPDRSTMIPNSNGKDSVPPDFKEIPMDDPRCAAAQEFYRQFAKAVMDIIGNGPWPGLPLAP